MDELAVGYYKSMDATRGRPGKGARLVIGAVIIKHKLNLSDEETVLPIQENPYLRWFVGLSSYKDEAPFTPSLFVTIRRRVGTAVFASFEQTILASIEEKKASRQSTNQPEEEKAENQGQMVVDATVAELAIRYPTDLSLLDEAREVSEAIIDELFKLSTRRKKPRTYRQQARKDYLAVAKKRKAGIKLRRKSTKQQL